MLKYKIWITAGKVIPSANCSLATQTALTECIYNLLDCQCISLLTHNNTGYWHLRLYLSNLFKDKKSSQSQQNNTNTKCTGRGSKSEHHIAALQNTIMWQISSVDQNEATLTHRTEKNKVQRLKQLTVCLEDMDHYWCSWLWVSPTVTDALLLRNL